MPTGMAAMADELVSLSALPAIDDVVDAALRLVAVLAQATVGGADGVSVSLTRHDRLYTVAATNETIAGMDRDQYATGEGPCIDAASQGRVFHVSSLAGESRWPSFTPRAYQRGINSILSTPLVARSRPVGALNIYSFAERAFAGNDQELASVFATQASGILIDAGVTVTGEQLSRRLRDALQARAVIAQAQGVIMATEGVSADAAYSELLVQSRSTDQPLRERAALTLAATQAIPPSVAASD